MKKNYPVRHFSPWVHVTNDCNLSCDYCHVEKTNDIMTGKVYDSMHRVFGELLKNDVERIFLRIAGGEPTLAFDIWGPHIHRMITDYGSDNRFKVSVLTNFIDIPDAFEGFIKANKVGLSISMDGYHDPVSMKVRHNISAFCPDPDDVMILTVITPDKYRSLPDLARYVAETGFHWKVNADYFYRGNPSPSNVITTLTECLDILEDNNYPIEDKFRFHNDVMGWGNHFCGAGINACSINTNGDMFVCQTLHGKKPFSNVCDDADHLYLLRNQSAEPVGHYRTMPDECSECDLLTLCRGDCPLHNTKERRKYLCEVKKEILPLYCMKVLRQRRNE